MEVVIPLVEFLPITLLIFIPLLRLIPPEDRAFMRNLVIAGGLLRILLAIIFATIPSTRIFHEDSNGYEGTALLVATSWLGEAPPIHLSDVGSITNGSYPGFLALCSVLYYAFGRYRLVVTAFTSLCGLVSIILLYVLTTRVFHRLVARRAAVFVALFPSIVLWSAMALKDPVVICLLLIGLNAAFLLRRRFRVDALLLVVGSAAAIWIVRYYIVYFLAISVAMSLIIVGPRGRRPGSLGARVAAAAVLALVLTVFGWNKNLSSGLDNVSLARAATYRAGMVATANSGFAADADVSTPLKAAAFLPIGLSVLMLGPFPWQMTSLRALLALPEMLVWWALIPALFRGIRFALRREFSASAPLVVFAASLCLAYAITLGNVGAAFRQRAQVVVFLFAFAALGQYIALCRRRGIDPDLLRADAPSDARA